MSQSVRGYLVGSGGNVGRVDPGESSVVHWDRTIQRGHNAGGHEEVEAAQLSNGKWSLRFVAANVVLNGAPKWECGTDLDRQFETRPANQVGGDESWTGVVFPNGRIEFVVEHEMNGQRFTSVPVTFVENV